MKTFISILFALFVSSAVVAQDFDSHTLLGEGIGDLQFAAGEYYLTGDSAEKDHLDSYSYAYTTLSTDGEVIVNVAGFLNAADQYSKAGILVRSSLDQNAQSVLLAMTSGAGTHWAERAEGAIERTEVYDWNHWKLGSSAWLRLVRNGNTLTGSYSQNGVDWVQIHSSNTTLPLTVYIGLAVAGNNAGQLVAATLRQASYTIGAAAPADDDGDGLTNGDEYAAGTDPNTSANAQYSFGPIIEYTTVDNVAFATVTARGYINDFEHPDNTWDGYKDTKWLDATGVPVSENPSWIGIEFAEPYAVNTIALTSPNDASLRDPENFNIQGSTDGVTWQMLGQFSGVTFHNRFETKTFTFINALAYRFYRLNITNLGEWR